MKLFTAQKGFTLIELLIVIALLGSLAVGLLATIDPFEQLKKGRDTSIRNTVSELYNASLRYYSVKGRFPWVTVPTSGAPIDLTTEIVDMIDTGELKNRFFELAGTANLARIQINSTSSDSVAVCFTPESKGFQEDPVTVYDMAGAVVASGCKSQTSSGGTDCAFCIQ